MILKKKQKTLKNIIKVFDKQKFSLNGNKKSLIEKKNLQETLNYQDQIKDILQKLQKNMIVMKKIFHIHL